MTAKPPKLSVEALLSEKAAMTKMMEAMPKTEGLAGLGIFAEGEIVQSPLRHASPSGRSTHIEHTGLTPLVKSSIVTDASSTPTRAKTSSTPTFTVRATPKAKPSAKSSPSSSGVKKRSDSKTPLTKSRPMFRLDTGSGKKSSKPQGHKMSPHASPWGVFGSKDGWKPLAPPNVSRAIAEATRLVSEDAEKSQMTNQSSPAGKRQAQGGSINGSPSKRFRQTEHVAGSSSNKENMTPSSQSMSPSKRSYPLSVTYRNSPTALPLSTIR